MKNLLCAVVGLALSTAFADTLIGPGAARLETPDSSRRAQGRPLQVCAERLQKEMMKGEDT